ncbi:hypothetical protein MML48_scaffold00000226 [Holotrichia oblita]|nr:hypothetical protein MML48_scaffold00000226 [Holotrichia oblita]
MQLAVNTVLNGNMGYHRASVSFAIPQTTLERYVKQRDHVAYSVSKVLGSKRQVFSPQQLAFQLAKQNGLDHPINTQDKLAGKRWIQGFLERHKDLSIRKPEATSGTRAMGFNKVAVQQFFKLLEDTVQKRQLTADKIFNVDETAITVNPKGC